MGVTARTKSHNVRPTLVFELASGVSVLKIRLREGRRQNRRLASGSTCAREMSMRRIRYAVAMSLDGYIAGPKGEADWIIMDPDIDFRALFKQFDTVLLGRRTFELMVRAGQGALPGMKTFLFSRTLRQRDYPEVTIVARK